MSDTQVHESVDFYQDSSGDGTRDWNLNYRNMATTVPMPVDSITYYLVGNKYNFEIPDDSTIDGIKLEIYGGVGYSFAVLVETYSAKIVKGGTISGDEQATPGSAIYWPDASTLADTYGGATELWGLSWTVADINADDFGVAIAIKGLSDGGKFQIEPVVEYLKLTVYYTPPAGGGGGAVRIMPIGKVGL